MYSISLGTDPSLASNNPAIFSVPSGIKTTCCTCLTITVTLISEQPTRTS